MNPEKISLNLQLLPQRYEQLKNLVRLLQVLDRDTLSETQVAEKLLIHALENFSTANTPQPANTASLLNLAAPEGFTGLPNQSHQATNQTDPLAENSQSAFLKIFEDRGAFFERLPMGTKIALVCGDHSLKSRFLLQLASVLNCKMPVLYLAPDLLGDFSELYAQFNIRPQATMERKKVIHFIPDNKTQWKQQLVTSRGNLLYRAVIFDNVFYEPQEVGFLNAMLENAVLDADLPLTEIHWLTNDPTTSDDPQDKLWPQAVDLLIKLEGDTLTILKNSIKED
jgi:hypothetical protein